jgi:hypothetical protein
VQAVRTIYKVWMAVIAVAVLVPIGAAGYGAFYSANRLKDEGDTMTHTAFDHGWTVHADLGWLLVYAILLALLLALIARIGRPLIWWQLALAVAGVLQIVFALAGEDQPGIGVLHPLNAFVIMGLVGVLAHRAWRGAPA